MRFDLCEEIPVGAVITDARIVTTTRAGYAQDGDPNHHVLFLEDDDWSEDRRARGTLARPTAPSQPGDPTLEAGGGDIRYSDRALGLGVRLPRHVRVDFAGNQTIDLPDERRQRAEAVRRLQGRPDQPGGD